MHELTICEALLERIEQERATRRFSHVRRVRVEIGHFSCVDPDALRYAFEIMNRETFLEHTILQIDRPRGRATCLACGAEVEVESRQDDCPVCKSSHLKPSGGDEMRFIEMEIV
jgi:hydrogenase nickel incorporation protein HypA/HybF